MTKILFVLPSFKITGGMERALINIMSLLPTDMVQIDLLLISGSGEMFNLIPSNVNVLPFLKQFDTYTQDLENELIAADNLRVLEIRRKIKKQSEDKEFNCLPLMERHKINWENGLKSICPEYKGYDVAVGFDWSLPTKIVAEKVTAKRKLSWLHLDYCKIEPGIGLRHNLKYWDAMDFIISVGTHITNEFVKALPTLADRVRTLQIPLPIEEILRLGKDEVPVEISQARNENKFIILTMARITEQKGVDLMAYAVQELNRKGLDFVWLVIGDSVADKEYAEYISNLINELQINDTLRVLGNKENPYNYCANCDLYVQPSRVEGKPVAIDEVKLFGKPIIVTDYSTARDSINHNHDGVICSFDAEDLANEIYRLFLDAETRNRLSHNAKETFNLQGLYDEYAQLFCLNDGC